MLRTEQEAWRRERAGYVSASRFGDVIAFGKNGQPLKARQDYLAEIVTERLTGEPYSMILAPSLGWGNDVEPYAKIAYQVETGNVIEDVQLVKHPDIAWVACTPDGLIDNDGGYESKCPASSMVHLQTWLNGMPTEHQPQVQGGMWITGRKWWEFVSYDPRMPRNIRLYRQRIARDDTYIANLDEQVRAFLKEVDAMLAKLAKLGVTELRKAA